MQDASRTHDASRMHDASCVRYLPTKEAKDQDFLTFRADIFIRPDQINISKSTFMGVVYDTICPNYRNASRLLGMYTKLIIYFRIINDIIVGMEEGPCTYGPCMREASGMHACKPHAEKCMR